MAGSPELTRALVVGGLRSGESSRIVRLLTTDFGLVSAMAHGALRPRSRFGASLSLLSEGVAHLNWSRSSDLHRLVAFDLSTPHSALGSNLGRYLAASAMAELVVRCVPHGANPQLYRLVEGSINALEHATPAIVEQLGIHLLWQLVAELGVAPMAGHCVRDGNPLHGDEPSVVVIEAGGLLCPECSRLHPGGIRLAENDVAALQALLAPNLVPQELDPPHLAAHRRLLSRWASYHLGLGQLPALELWQRGLSP